MEPFFHQDQRHAAEEAYRQGDYPKALEDLEKLLGTTSVPEAEWRKALELKALIFRKQDDVQKAAATYRELVEKYDTQGYLNEADSARLEERLKKDAAGPHPEEGILSYYYEYGQALREEVTRAGKGAEAVESDRGAAERAFEVASQFGYRRSFSETALRELREGDPAAVAAAEAAAQTPDELDEDPGSFAPGQAPVVAPPAAGAANPSAATPAPKVPEKFRWSMGLGYYNWTEHFTYRDPSDVASPLHFEARLPCLAGGFDIELPRLDIGVWGCIAMGLGRVDPNRVEVPYRHGRIAVQSVLIGPAFWWKSARKEVAIGLEIPVIYRAAQIPVPSQDGASIDPRNNFAFAFLAGIRSTVGRVRVVTEGGWGPTFGEAVFGIKMEWAFRNGR
ncbi:MAG TPA: tetratricopeptide repeat protein [Bdellovibrionota bacterium]|nr:tetratricopeptide repeat protein [Bdellovibrionota bacterium]